MSAPAFVAAISFSDASGINGGVTANSPYAVGVTADAPVTGEPDWRSVWHENHGGVADAPQLGIVSAAAALERDGGLAIAAASEGAWIFRPFTPQWARRHRANPTSRSTNSRFCFLILRKVNFCERQGATAPRLTTEGAATPGNSSWISQCVD